MTDPLPRSVGSDGADVEAACEVLRAIGSPNRLQMVLALEGGPHCVHELVDLMGISQALASQHLRVLRTTGLVLGRRKGKEMVYELADEHIAHIARDALAHGQELVGAPGRAAQPSQPSRTTPTTSTKEQP